VNSTWTRLVKEKMTVTFPPDLTGCSRSNYWGLSYDDGPSEYTPKVLEELRQKNLKATFFVMYACLLCKSLFFVSY
jgi:hypothetical protein